HRPFAHGVGDRVGEGRIERLAAVERRLQAAEDVLGEALALDVEVEDVLPVRVAAGAGEIGAAERGAVRRPLGGGDILLASPGHGAEGSSVCSSSAYRCNVEARARAAAPPYPH